ncbi:MAG: DUF1080 domain-containing protein [Planctomycetaceae bacterium]
MQRLWKLFSRPTVAVGLLLAVVLLVDDSAEARRRRICCSPCYPCQPVQCWTLPNCGVPQHSAIVGSPVPLAAQAVAPAPATTPTPPPEPPAYAPPAKPLVNPEVPAKPAQAKPAQPQPAAPPMPPKAKAKPAAEKPAMQKKPDATKNPEPKKAAPAKAPEPQTKPADKPAAAKDAPKPAPAKEGFTALFNGKDLSGWHGMTTFDVKKLEAMSEADRKKQQDEWNQTIPKHWKAVDGVIENDGEGAYLTTDGNYRDYELLVDYKTVPKADSGIYLKGTPQVQIWDHTNEDQFKHGSDKGSGGLWNNSKGAPGKDPAVLADKPFGEWNHFRILQTGARTSVWLNEKQVVNHAIMENYFHRDQPLYPEGPIQLQTHGGPISWRNVKVRELPAAEANAILRKNSGGGFTKLFNGKDLNGWKGAVDSYEVADGAIRCKSGKGGVLHTPDMYGDFVARLEFKLPAGGNNGLAIRYPGEGDTAYAGMCELQVLDSEHPKYAKLDARQYHGSAYGMAPAARGYLRPTGEWNFQVVTVKGSTVQVELNGNKILDADLSKVTDLMAGRPHPGKDRKEGYFGFAGHNDPVEFRNVEIKRLDAK